MPRRRFTHDCALAGVEKPLKWHLDHQALKLSTEPTLIKIYETTFKLYDTKSPLKTNANAVILINVILLGFY